MAETHAVRGLKVKREELRAEIAQLERMKRVRLRHIKTIDESLRVLTGERLAAIPYGRKRRWLFRHGELQRMVGAIMREAGGEIETIAIARAVIERMDWDTDDEELAAFVADKVKDVRKRLSGRGAANSLSTGG